MRPEFTTNVLQEMGEALVRPSSKLPILRIMKDVPTPPSNIEAGKDFQQWQAFKAALADQQPNY